MIGRSDDPLSAADVSQLLRDTPLRAAYHLDKLETAGLVEEYVDEYSITPQGRAYIVENDLDR